MRIAFFLLSSALFATSDPAFANLELDWASGVGMRSCSELDEIDKTNLVDWTFGYWTGANLYLGGTDICSERADLRNLGVEEITVLLGIQCRSLPSETPIMMAAFNALKGLPKVPGSKAAACSGD